MSSNLIIDRILVLLKTGRFTEAEQALKQELAKNPDDEIALGFLAVCYLDAGRKEDAIAPAKRAVAISPDAPWLLAILGRVMMLNNRLPEARQAAESARNIDPTYTGAYEMLSQLAYHDSKWQEALEHAEAGLSHDPEDADLVNLRAMALMKLNRISEASATIDFALKQDPEDTFSHSNKGWVLIEQGRYDEAIATFRDALRFGPENEYARDGLKEAIKGKNWLYRGVLRYALFMGKLSQQNQWLVIIGMYVAVRIISKMADANEALRPFLLPLVVLYMAFVFASWIGTPLSNLVLRLHAIGKHALTEVEKRDSSLIGLNLAFALLVLLGSLAATPPLSDTLNLLGITLLAMLIPLGGYALSAPEGAARKTMAYLAIGLFVFGPGSQLISLINPDFSAEGMLLTLFMIGIFFYSWIANYILSKDRRRFN